MKTAALPRSYYLPPWRSIAVGTILLLMGLATTFGTVDYKRSFGDILQSVLISFDSISGFLMSLLMLFFKALFFAGGYFYIKFSKRVERARLDNKGFYYREIPAGSRLDKIGMDTGPLTFIPYASIKAVSISKSRWSGSRVVLTTDSKVSALPALGVLTEAEKAEIAAVITDRIHRSSIRSPG